MLAKVVACRCWQRWWLVDVGKGGVLHFCSCPLYLSIIRRLCYGRPRDINSDIGGYAMMFVGSVWSVRTQEAPRTSRYLCVFPVAEQ